MFNFLRKKKKQTGSLTIYINQNYGYSVHRLLRDICKVLSLNNLMSAEYDMDGDIETVLFETDKGPIKIPQGLDTFVLDPGFDISLRGTATTEEIHIYQNEDVDLLIQRIPIIQNLLFDTYKLSTDQVTTVIKIPMNDLRCNYYTTKGGT